MRYKPGDKAAARARNAELGPVHPRDVAAAIGCTFGSDIPTWEELLTKAIALYWDRRPV